MDLERPDVLFAAVRMGQRTTWSDAAHPTRMSGGSWENSAGRHPTAASANLRNRDPWEVLDDFLWIVEARLPVSWSLGFDEQPVECLDVDGG